MPSILNPQPMIRRLLAVLLLGMLVMPSGCSRKEIEEKMKQAQEKIEAVAETTVEAVEEKLPESGSIKLRMTPATESGTAEVELISIGDGRPNVVQIASYDTASQSRSYPTIMLHGTTTAQTAASLAQAEVKCDMYFQASAGSAIAMTAPGDSVTVSFGAFNTEDNALTATLSSATLVGSDDKKISLSGGDIVAVIRGEGN